MCEDADSLLPSEDQWLWLLAGKKHWSIEDFQDKIKFYTRPTNGE